MTRKGFLAMISVGTGGLASLAVGIPIIGFVASPLIQKERQAWRDVGAVDSFRVGSTVKVDLRYADQLPWAGSTASTSAWLRRVSRDSFICYANTCPHLGCPVSWLQTPEIFLCPCHGSVFNADGTVAGGPSPRPLYTYPCRIRNGLVEVKTEPLPLVNFTAGW